MEIEKLKERVESAKEEVTKAEAIMGEVKDNLANELAKLKDTGIEIPDNDGKSDIDYYEKVLQISEKFIEEKEAKIKEKTTKVEELVNSWRTDDDE